MRANRRPLNIIKRLVAAFIGPIALGMIDYLRFPEQRDPWGGPFNGQQKRRELFLSLVKKCRPAAIVETGTYLGVSTEFMADVTNLPIYSVEADARTFGFASMRLRNKRNVTLSLDDSREFLTKFFAETATRYKGEPLLFYLDAHWSKDLPLPDEIATIFSSGARAIVMIDDFQVPDDAGYRYDNEVGYALTVDCVALQVAQFQLVEFYPTSPSAVETGQRRGCIVLARDRGLVAALSSISLLRERLT
jgi:hypothetical protein